MHPCLSCGACCATWAVQFDRSEVAPKGVTPKRLIEPTDSAKQVIMAGTGGETPRCAALTGTIGDRASCSIYVQRPSICREVTASYERGEKDPTCDAARKRHGLAPLRPRDWL